jgi:WD40 repeat protein
VNAQTSTRRGDDRAARADAGASGSDAPAAPDVFVSYSRTDEGFVRRLDAALRQRGKDVWVDWEDIPATADWRARIFAGIDSSRTFVAVLSPELLASGICREELEHATLSNKRLVPVVRRSVDRRSTPDELRIPNWIFFRESDDFERSVDQLVEALDTDLEWLETHARLTVRATEWDREQRDASFLLRGRDLKEAEAWVAEQASHREAATRLQADYIVASRKGATRRQRILFTGVVLALTVAVVLGIVAMIQRNDAIDQSKLSRSRELAASASAHLTTDPELSLLLARNALEVRETPQAKDALRRSLRESHLRLTIREGTGRMRSVTVFRDGIRIPTRSVAFSPDGTRILTVARETARIWDARTGKLLHGLRGHRGRVTGAEFSPDGTRVVTASADRSARVWDTATGRVVVVLRGHRASVVGARFSPDGRHVLTMSDDRAQLWYARTGKRIAFLRGASGVTGSAFSRNGRRIATTTRNGSLRIWDGRTGKLLRFIPPKKYGGEVQEPLYAPSFDPSGHYVVAARWSDARVWDARTGQLYKVLGGHAGLDGIGSQAVNSATLSADGRFLATSSPDGTVRLWQTNWDDATLVWPLSVLEGHTGDVSDAGFSRDGTSVVSVGDDGTARVWDSTTGDTVAVLRKPGGTIFSAAFAPDGNRIVTATDDGARVWALSGFRPIRQLRGSIIAFSPNGRVMTTRENGSVDMWDVASGGHVAVVPAGAAGAHENPWSEAATAVSRDGSVVVTYAKTAVVWDARAGTRLSLLRQSIPTVPGSSRSTPTEPRASGRHRRGRSYERSKSSSRASAGPARATRSARMVGSSGAIAEASVCGTSRAGRRRPCGAPSPALPNSRSAPAGHACSHSAATMRRGLACGTRRPASESPCSAVPMTT